MSQCPYGCTAFSLQAAPQDSLGEAPVSRRADGTTVTPDECTYTFIVYLIIFIKFIP